MDPSLAHEWHRFVFNIDELSKLLFFQHLEWVPFWLRMVGLLAIPVTAVIVLATARRY